MPGADFGRKDAAGRQPHLQTLSNPPKGRKTALPAIEGAPRIKAANLRWQTGERYASDIRWVRDDYRETPRQRAAPVTDKKLGAVRKTQHRGIFASGDHCTNSDIDADADGCWEFGQQREQQAAAPDPEVKNAKGSVAVGNLPEHRLDEKFSLSGRGSRVSVDKVKRSPQNSRQPRIRLNGSPATNRASDSRRRSTAGGSIPRSG